MAEGALAVARGLRRRQILSVPWGLLGAALTWPSLAQSTRAQPGTLRLGVLQQYKPFSFTEGLLQGFDVDVARRIAMILRAELVIEAGSFSDLQKKLASGGLDAIANQLIKSPENRGQFDFVRAYAFNQLVCVQHESDERDFLSLDDLLGKKLGVLSNTGVEVQARGALGPAVRGFKSIDLAFLALAQQKIDAVLEESLIADFYIQRDQLPIKVTAPFAAPLTAGWAVHKGNLPMAQLLSGAVQSMLADGSFKAISQRWFGYDVSKPSVSHRAPLR
jgi:cystine transport system substrate-binding protein